MEVVADDHYSSSIERGQIPERQSSIEREPRTLNIRQLDFAREEAQYVVKTRSMEEALRIFTEGLVPIVRASGADERDSASVMNCGVDQDELWDITSSRDVVSAPF